MLAIYLLGPFYVWRTEQEAPIVLRRTTRALLAYLAATGQPHSRHDLMDLFCPDVDDPQSALRSLLSRIRQKLGSQTFLAEGDTILFNSAVAWVDCLDFAGLLETDLASLSVETLTRAIDLYRGDFLINVSLSNSPDFEFWSLNERARYQKLYELGLSALTTQLIDRGMITAAIPRALQLVRSNPLGEEAVARLMWLYARNGQREAALEQYEQFRQYLQRELAVEPTPELTALRADIAAGQIHPLRSLQTPKVEVGPALREPVNFVGRTAEFDQLLRTWRGVNAGQPAVALINAEAGMGKTRLVRELASRIPEVEFLAGECFETARSLAFSPWLEVLETRLERLPDTSLHKLSTFAVDYLARLIPGLARRLQRGRPPVLPSSTGELNRLFTAVGEFLFNLPDTPPLLLFIDNLQWADEASLQLFHFLARQASTAIAPRTKVAQTRFALIGALRTEEIGDEPALQALISDLDRQAEHLPFIHLRLSPLSIPAIDAITLQLWPALPAGYRPHVCDMLLKATRGYPLFVVEILRELAHIVEIPSALPVPETIHELFKRRLDRMPEGSRQVVEALAVLGSPATPAQAQQASGRSEEETIQAIDQGLHRGLLQAWVHADQTRYDLSHDLMREAVLGQLSPVRRQLLHRRAAITHEQAGAPAATLVYHWRMAGNVDKEGHYAALAGEQAAGSYANEEAIRYLERALQLIQDPEKRIEVMTHLGDVLQLLGRHPEAEATYHQALSLADMTGNRQAQARTHVALGRLRRLKGDYREALAWLEQALAIYEELGDETGLAETLWGMGAVFWSQLDYPRALACFEKQLAIARRLENLQWIGAAVGSMGVVFAEQGNYAQALECYTQRIQIDLQRNDRLSMAKTIGNLGIVYAEQGEYVYALACYHWLLSEMLELGDRQNVCVALGNMIQLYTALAEYPLAERVALAAIALGRSLTIPLYTCEYLYAAAELYYREKRYAEAQTLNKEAINLASQIDRMDILLPARLLSVRLRMATGEIAATEAIEELERLLGEWREDQQQAAIVYELWRIDREQSRYAQQAIALYGKLFTSISNAVYRQRYEELTGETLPGSSPLPAPPGVVTSAKTDIESLLERVEPLII